MGSKSRFGGIGHDTWVNKNASLARAERTLNKPKSSKLTIEDKSCFRCNQVKNCKKFISNKSRYSVSFGGDSNISTCEKWVPIKDNSIKNTNKIKSLMNEFKRNLKNG